MRDFPHLRNRSRRRFDRTRKDRLDRIDDDRAGLQSLDFVDDVFEVGLRQQVDIFSFDCESLATQLDLAFRLFTGNVEHARACGTEFVGYLKKQRALADPWITTDQDECAGYDAAAENTIKLGDTRRNPYIIL